MNSEGSSLGSALRNSNLKASAGPLDVGTCIPPLNVVMISASSSGLLPSANSFDVKSWFQIETHITKIEN